MNRPHTGGHPPKACWVFIDGGVFLSSSIPLAAARMGVTGAPGSALRRHLGKSGVYRSKTGAVCWLDGGEVPTEAAEAWQLLNGGVW